MSNPMTLLVNAAHPATLDSSGVTTYAGIDVLGGQLTITGSGVDVVTGSLIANRGFVNVEGGATFDVTGGAENSATFFTIGTGGTLIEGGSEYNSLSPVDFTGGGGKLELNTSGGFDPRPLSPILGFSAGDTIEVSSAINGYSYNDATGKLTLLDNGNTAGSLIVVGSGLAAGFTITPDGTSGYDIGVACFLPGTMVLTDRGEVAAGEVSIGDRLVTLSGAAKPVKWIGRRGYPASVVASAPHVAPVLVMQGALAEGLPKRDLYLSPCHALYVDGVLIEAGDLVNGVSVVRCAVEDRVDYVNFEFDDHEVIFVEGAAAETGAGRGNREVYDNGAEYARLYPAESVARITPYCAPRLDCGFVVEAVRGRIDARAAVRPDIDWRTAPLKGWIEHLDDSSIRGVAYCEGGAAPVVLEIVIDGAVVGEVVANAERDLRTESGRHDGRCGFEVKLPAGVSPYLRHVVNVRRVSDKAEIAGSPYMMEAATPMSVVGRQKLGAAIADAAANAGSVAEMDRALAFLATKAELLLQAKADLAGGRAGMAALRPLPGRSEIRLADSRRAA